MVAVSFPGVMNQPDWTDVSRYYAKRASWKDMSRDILQTSELHPDSFWFSDT